MRIVTAEEAVAGIQSGQQVFVHGGAASPSVLLEALARRAAELQGVGVIHFHIEGPAPHLEPEMVDSFSPPGALHRRKCSCSSQRGAR